MPCSFAIDLFNSTRGMYTPYTYTQLRRLMRHFYSPNSTCRILMASSSEASWFMSMAWIASPRVKITAWFWLFGLPSPTRICPGSC